jgi:hypothetical protein
MKPTVYIVPVDNGWFIAVSHEGGAFGTAKKEQRVFADLQDMLMFVRSTQESHRPPVIPLGENPFV